MLPGSARYAHLPVCLQIDVFPYRTTLLLESFRLGDLWTNHCPNLLMPRRALGGGMIFDLVLLLGLGYWIYLLDGFRHPMRWDQVVYLWSTCWLTWFLKRLVDDLYVSSDLKSIEELGYIETMSQHELICNAITSVVAPQMYDAGMGATQGLCQGMHLANPADAFTTWSSVWSGISVIVNRKTPLHRDWGGAFPIYDLLVSGGTHTGCFLDIPDLGSRLRYLPGTAVAISGKVLRHGVKDWEGGERVCNAHFMKDAVHQRLGQPRPNWPRLDDYYALIDRS